MLSYLMFSCLFFVVPATAPDASCPEINDCQKSKQVKEGLALYFSPVIYLTPEQAEMWPPQVTKIIDKNKEKNIIQTFTI
jgi:hypothetical protein